MATLRCDRCKTTLQVSHQSSIALEYMDPVPRCGVCGQGQLQLHQTAPVARYPRDRVGAGLKR